MYRLVRDSTGFVDGHHVKALDRLNRDLSKVLNPIFTLFAIFVLTTIICLTILLFSCLFLQVIVVDWNAASVKQNPRNALLIPRWDGNDSDRTLIDLAAFLKSKP